MFIVKYCINTIDITAFVLYTYYINIQQRTKHMRSIKEIKQDIEALKQQISINEMSNDGYCLSPQCKDDDRRMFELKQELRKATEMKQ